MDSQNILKEINLRSRYIALLDGLDRAGATIIAACVVGGILTYSSDVQVAVELSVDRAFTGFLLGLLMVGVCGHFKRHHERLVKRLEETLSAAN